VAGTEAVRAGETEDLARLFDACRVFYGCKSDQAACTEFLLQRFNHGASILFLALQESQAVGLWQLAGSWSHQAFPFHSDSEVIGSVPLRERGLA
jgi:hypothetical protein